MLPSSLHFAVTNRPQQGCLATLLNATEAARWVLGPSFSNVIARHWCAPNPIRPR